MLLRPSSRRVLVIPRRRMLGPPRSRLALRHTSIICFGIRTSSTAFLDRRADSGRISGLGSWRAGGLSRDTGAIRSADSRHAPPWAPGQDVPDLLWPADRAFH